MMDQRDTMHKIAAVHALIDELNRKGVAISSVMVRNDTALPEFHGHEPIVAILKKYRGEISAANCRVVHKVNSGHLQKDQPRDIERLPEPLTERTRDELRTHVFTIVKMWQNLDRDQVDYNCLPPFWPAHIPFAQGTKRLKKGQLIEVIHAIYAEAAKHPVPKPGEPEGSQTPSCPSAPQVSAADAAQGQQEDAHECDLGGNKAQHHAITSTDGDTACTQATDVNEVAHSKFQEYTLSMARFRATYRDMLQWREQSANDSDQDDNTDDNDCHDANPTLPTLLSDSLPTDANAAFQAAPVAEITYAADLLNITEPPDPKRTQTKCPGSGVTIATRSSGVTIATPTDGNSCAHIAGARDGTSGGESKNDSSGNTRLLSDHQSDAEERNGARNSFPVGAESFQGPEDQRRACQGSDEATECRGNAVDDQAITSSPPASVSQDGNVHSPDIIHHKDSRSDAITADHDVDEVGDASPSFTTFLNWNDEGEPDEPNYYLGPHLSRDSTSGAISSIYYDPTKRGRELEDAWAVVTGDRVVPMQDGTPSIGSFPLTNAGLPWSRSTFLAHYTKTWDTCVARQKATSSSAKETVTEHLEDFESFFDETVRRVPPAGLEMSEISEISIRLTDYKRKRLVLPDVSTVQVQFSDEADMNNVYQKVRDAYEDLFTKRGTRKKLTSMSKMEGEFKKPFPRRALRAAKQHLAEPKDLPEDIGSGSLRSNLLPLPAPIMSAGSSKCGTVPKTKKSKLT